MRVEQSLGPLSGKRGALQMPECRRQRGVERTDGLVELGRALQVLKAHMLPDPDQIRVGQWHFSRLGTGVGEVQQPPQPAPERPPRKRGPGFRWVVGLRSGIALGDPGPQGLEVRPRTLQEIVQVGAGRRDLTVKSIQVGAYPAFLSRE